MAMNMNAMLRITARTTGGEQVQALSNKITQVEAVTKRLTAATGLLGPALGALAPVATIGSLGALVKTQIDAADKFYDLSQRTGVSVEALARFNKAAKLSGTDIDGVSKSLAKLSKGLYEAANTAKGATAEALQALGISATDAEGKLKTADQVTLEIANKFKTMPDGVEKTAIAMQLFGKAGAEMIPMLNMGGDAIDKLGVKMTTAFAEKADEYSDKLTTLSGKVGGLGTEIAIALLPAMEVLVNLITTVVNAFMKMPEPLRSVVGVVTLLAIGFTTLTPLIVGLTTAISALGSLKIGAIIAGWLGIIGPLIKGIAAFAAGFVSWPVVIAAALIAVGILIYNFKNEIGGVFQGIWKGITNGFNVVKDELISFLTSFPKNLETFADAISASITTVWNWLGDRFNDLTTLATNLVRGISNIFKGIGDALSAPFRAAADIAKNVLRSLLTFSANIINTFIARVNQLIRGVNNVSGRVAIGSISEISYVNIPQFATGAYVTGPTMAQVGEGGQPEYVIPANRMAAASNAFLQGARGVDVVNGQGPSGGGGRTAVYVQNTGPIMQTPDGSQWARVEDLAAVAEAVAIMASGRR